MKNPAKIKKTLMTHMWRFQQSQAFYSVIFWSLALAGIFYERSGYYFEKYLGMSANKNEQVATKMAVLMILVVLLIVFFGFLYDTIFRLWEQQSMVKVERNVYSQYKIPVRWLLLHRYYYIPLLKSRNKDGRHDKQIKFVEDWTNKLLSDDPVAKLYYDHVENWIKSDEIYWKPPSTERLMKVYRMKSGEDANSQGGLK